MSDREPMTTINGERMTWAAALEAEGLPYDPRLAGRALDYHDLRKMTREYVKVTAPKTAAAPTPSRSPARPAPPNFDAIPAALQARPAWLLWRLEARDGLITKVPYRAAEPGRKASTTDPATWSDFETARDAYTKWYEHGIDGVGFVLSDADPFVGIDVDHIRNPVTGELDPRVIDQVLGFGSYAEYSQSGDGVHVIAIGRKPGADCRKGDAEMYATGRYFVMTGRHIDGTPDDVTEANPGALEAFYGSIARETRREVSPAPKAPAAAPAMADDEIIERARDANNGAKFSSLFDAGSTAGYPSHSEADAALCALLAFWTRDAYQIDRLFRRSGLMRDKWDTPRGKSTYGADTIESAIGLGGETYTPTAPPARTRAPKTAETDTPRATIQANDRQLPDITSESVDALRAWNAPPRMFIRAGELVRIDADEHDRPVIRPMLENRVRWALGQAADYVTVEARRKGPIVSPTIPPMPVARNILASADLCTWFPPLVGIIESPGIHRDGTLIIEPGYDVASGLYYNPGNGLVVAPIPDEPTPEDIADATALICETVCDFPFVVEADGTQASKANAIAALMTPIIRPMIRGRVPMSLFDKPQMGSGASLLADMIVTIATGSSAAMTQAPTVREEWGKLLLSELSTGRAVIVFDNVTGSLSSPELASAITSSVYNGRVLGTTTTKHIENQPCWIATGINLEIGGDIPRRCVWIRMDPDDPRPWLRDKTEFKHPQLLEWAIAERGTIIAAVLTVARAWVRAGRKVPKETQRLAVFEDWCETLGGILAFMGIKGFLGNLDRQYEEADTEGPQWGAFLAKWHERFGDTPVSASEVIDELEKNASAIYVDTTMRGCAPDDILDAVAVKGKANRQKFGQLLRYRKDTRFATGFKLVAAGTKKRAVQWRVVDVKPGTGLDKWTAPDGESSQKEGESSESR